MATSTRDAPYSSAASALRTAVVAADSSTPHGMTPLTSAAVVLRAFPHIAALPHVGTSISAYLDCSGKRSLQDAVKLNDLRLLKRLVAASKLPLPPTRRYPRFLTFHVSDAALIAARTGQLDALKLLREVNAQAVADVDVFVVAAVCGHVDVLEWLHAQFAYDVESAMRLATTGIVVEGRDRVVAWLLQRWDTTDFHAVLKDALYHNQCAIVKLLSDFVTSDLATYATDAVACRGDLEMIEWLNERAPIQFSATAIGNVARTGRLDVIEWLHDKRGICPTMWTSIHAAQGGHLHIVEWLHARFPDTLSADTMDEAVMHGKLAIVQFLRERCGTSCSSKAMDGAARGGHLDVVTFLHEHYNDVGCTTAAMDEAAANGHLDVVKWLHEHRNEGCTVRAMHGAVMNRHMDVVQWLHEHRSEGCTVFAMNFAAAHDRLEMIQWLHEHRTEGCTTLAMDLAAEGGSLEIVQWLHSNRTEGCTTDAMDSAAGSGHLDMVKWLHANRTEGWTTMALFKAIQHAHVDVVQWLFEHGSKQEFPPVLHTAAAHGQFELVTFLLYLSSADGANLYHPTATVANFHAFYETLPELFVVEPIKVMAAAYERHDVLAWLQEIGASE